ncbi:NAD(P)/FAD-dependent oxidoreductase [Saccharopolyspora mangrovi]|uniref:FAD-dependent oxidoreductase n=1 Tax=Saccharopolyspora mangrovi TaxID=3082379 RepID=A0ABU6AJ52_9PSEU|nr:FAD-dependent oxidoreductase [Saccharopolyspora sp. S2-29]MEB3371340.1 FAD-dependent oxidoreductase [Saccharopolyspora sp. S2-29]
MTGGLVVVGASLAGLRAAEVARKAGHTGAITLIGDEPHLPYDRPPLSKAYLDAAEPPNVNFREEHHLRDELGVNLHLGSPARAVDTTQRTVHVGDQEIPYDGLVIATGATARTLPGTDGITGVHTLRTLDDAIAVRAALDAGARTVVVGSGFIGSEVASGARKRGLPITIVEAAPTPLARAIGAEMGEAVAGLHHRAGTDLRCGVAVERLEAEHGRVRRVHLSDGTTLEADLVVAGIGADPATGWLRGCGLELDNGIRCDATLAAVGASGVFAAGDVARWHNPLFEQLMRIEHWTSAAEQGAVAARNALEPGAAKPYSTVPYFWSDWYTHRIQFVGVPEADEVRIVSGAVDEDRFVALFRRGERLTGVLTLNGQAVVMKYRGLIARRASWTEALEFAERARSSAARG